MGWDQSSYPAPTFQRVSKDFVFHTISSPNNTTLNVSTHSSECTNLPANFQGPDYSYSLYVIPREDIFLVTLGNVKSLIEIQDADGVSIDNVQFQGGVSDVSEFYPRMSRPFWKVGGINLGLTNGSGLASGVKMGQQPHYAPVTCTPLGKVEVLLFTNVKSKSQGRYK
jgi:hypothetical protein